MISSHNLLSTTQEGALPHLVNLLRPEKSDQHSSGAALGPSASQTRPQDQAHAARIIALLSQVGNTFTLMTHTYA